MGHRFSSVWVQFVVCVTVFPKVVKWVKFQKFKFKKKKKKKFKLIQWLVMRNLLTSSGDEDIGLHFSGFLSTCIGSFVVINLVLYLF